MPNWCNNSLIINADKKTITTIIGMLDMMNYNPESVENVTKRRDEVLRNEPDENIREHIMREYEDKLILAKRNEEKVVKEDSVFATLVGLPPKEDDLPYYTTESYCNFYGTKWDISYDEYAWDYDDECITTNFETAWSPPIGFVIKLAEKFKGITSIELFYEEQGCDFAGKLVIEKDASGELMLDDECLRYEEGLYKYDTDYFWMNVNDNIEYSLENYDNQDGILERYHFVSAEDRVSIIEIINELKANVNE